MENRLFAHAIHVDWKTKEFDKLPEVGKSLIRTCITPDEIEGGISPDVLDKMILNLTKAFDDAVRIEVEISAVVWHPGEPKKEIEC
jgi:hypothetical protein